MEFLLEARWGKRKGETLNLEHEDQNIWVQQQSNLKNLNGLSMHHMVMVEIKHTKIKASKQSISSVAMLRPAQIHWSLFTYTENKTGSTALVCTQYCKKYIQCKYFFQIIKVTSTLMNSDGKDNSLLSLSLFSAVKIKKMNSEKKVKSNKFPHCLNSLP